MLARYISPPSFCLTFFYYHYLKSPLRRTALVVLGIAIHGFKLSALIFYLTVIRRSAVRDADGAARCRDATAVARNTAARF